LFSLSFSGDITTWRFWAFVLCLFLYFSAQFWICMFIFDLGLTNMKALLFYTSVNLFHETNCYCFTFFKSYTISFTGFIFISTTKVSLST
jgi:hypothetical protein